VLFIAGVVGAVAIVSWLATSNAAWLEPWIAISSVIIAISIASHSKAREYSFATWIVSAVVVAILYPQFILQIGSLKTVHSVTYLIQIAMFGMGATLTLQDFSRVFRMPKGVLVGMLLQFSVMPLSGWTIAYSLRLPPEIAVGLILVGACPGGVSSNVITYLAKGNVALSVTMTACSTLASPIMTPLMMYLLAGKSVTIDYFDMFRNILFTIFVPVLLGLVCNSILQKLRLLRGSTERYLAIVSMVAICFICAIIAANSSEAIRKVGAILFLAVFLHNLLGFLLGYIAAKSVRLNESDSRTVAIEVGLQNGGMAAMLATNVLRVPAAAIAPAIFAAVMNVTGSLLAAWWSRQSSLSGTELLLEQRVLDDAYKA